MMQDAPSPAQPLAADNLATAPSCAGAIFDCDGTLIDSMEEWRSAQRKVAESFAAELSDADEAYLMSCNIQQMAAYMEANFGIGCSPSSIAAHVHDHMLDFYRHRAQPRPGAVDYVRMLHDAGVRLCVLSSSPADCLEAVLGKHGLLPLFEHVFSTVDLGASKRESACYETVCELMGFDAERTWIYDDAPYALKAARAAGVRTVGVYDSDETAAFEDLVAMSDVAMNAYDALEPAFPPRLRQPDGSNEGATPE